MDALFDNDIVFKLAKGYLVDEALNAFGVEAVHVLDSMPYRMIERPPRRIRPHLDTDTVERMKSFVRHSNRLESPPDDMDFLDLCSESSGIDPGEAILLSHARFSPEMGLFTADKRFFKAVARTPEILEYLNHLRGCILSLEQVMLALIERMGFEALCSHAQLIAPCDDGIRIVFKTASSDPEEHARTALASGIRESAQLLGGLLYEYGIEQGTGEVSGAQQGRS